MPLLAGQCPPLVFSDAFQNEVRSRESIPEQPYVPRSEKLSTRFSQYASTVCEVARENGFESDWGRNARNPQSYFVEVFGCSREKFEQFEKEAHKRMIP